MKQTIVGFDKDSELHWRARLSCGHYQHVRHDPPLVRRDWVLSAEGRDSRIGQTLECEKCEEGKPTGFRHSGGTEKEPFPKAL